MLSVAMDINTIVMLMDKISTAPTDALVKNARETRTLKMDYGAVMAVAGYTTACSVPFGTSD